MPSDHDLVRLKPGDYLAVYDKHVGVTVFRVSKLRVDFRLLAHPGLVLPRWYCVKGYRAGRICAGPHSDIVREISAVLNQRVRRDRIPVSLLENIIVQVEVRDVITDRKQDALAEVNRYSVISRLKVRAE